MHTRKIVLTALFVAIGVVLPQTIHLFGGPALGSMLLPMHIPVFIGAMLLGPVAGIIIAISILGIGVMLGMPPILIASYMFFELIAYAFFSGLLYHFLKINVYISFLVSKILGMTIAIAALQIMMRVLSVGFPPVFGSIAMFYPGIIGIGLQILIVPSSVLLLKKEMNKHARLS